MNPEQLRAHVVLYHHKRIKELDEIINAWYKNNGRINSVLYLKTLNGLCADRDAMIDYTNKFLVENNLEPLKDEPA